MKTLILMVLALVLLLAPVGSGQALRFDFRGDLPFDRFGHAIASGGDINRDGFEDILVGAPVNSSSCNSGGFVRAFSGKDGAVLFTVHGHCLDGETSGLGWSVANAGDVNEDGWPDMVAGAIFDDLVGGDSGSAKLFLGPYGAVRYTFTGTFGDRSLFGYSVAGGADLNGDGVPDVIIGAPDDNSAGGAGGVFLFSGKDGSLIQAILSDEFPYLILGRAVALAGDWNQDGVTDFAVGAPYFFGPTPGIVRVYSGKGRMVLATLSGEFAGDAFGATLANAGDVNADGRDDLIVGAYDYFGTTPGKAFVFSGGNGALLYAFSGNQPKDYFGLSVAGAARNRALLGAGDVNGDGHADLLVGNWAYQISLGYVHLYSGKTGALLYRFDEASLGSAFGSSVAGLGDLDHDGLQDFAIGNYHEDQDRGHVRVHLGNDLFLCARPRSVVAGQTITLTVREMTAGDRALLTVTDVDGSAVFLPVATGTFDGTGTWQISAIVPPGFSGLTVALRAYAMDAAGKVRDSEDEAVRVQ
ncbi:MAG: FG-GAP-like repeat-containing protein [Planctomycetota bacterium]